MGFQVGMLHDTICLTDRFAIEGFLNAGVYYNQVKYSNVMGVFTTQTFADNTRTDSGGRVDVNAAHREGRIGRLRRQRQQRGEGKRQKRSRPGQNLSHQEPW